MKVFNKGNIQKQLLHRFVIEGAVPIGMIGTTPSICISKE